MSRVAKILILVAVVGIVVVLYSAGRGSGTDSPSTGGGGSVPWSDYAPAVQSRIDGMRAAKDCVGLQHEFDTADANNDATMSRTGHNNAALLGYIDNQMRAAGCY